MKDFQSTRDAKHDRIKGYKTGLLELLEKVYRKAVQLIK